MTDPFRLTITGADEGVLPSSLEQLSAEFPFLEWGILVSAKRAGRAPRYPSWSWRQSLRRLTGVKLSAHLCGSHARNVLGGDPDGWLADEGNLYSRIQVNSVFYPEEAASVFEQHPQREFILQVPAEDFSSPLLRLRNVSALLDASGGRGVERGPFPSPPPGIRFGCAGGHRPETLLSVLRALPRGCSWADIETGVRSESDELDLLRVRMAATATRAWLQDRGIIGGWL